MKKNGETYFQNVPRRKFCNLKFFNLINRFRSFLFSTWFFCGIYLFIISRIMSRVNFALMRKCIRPLHKLNLALQDRRRNLRFASKIGWPFVPDQSPVSRINIRPGKCPELDNSSYHVNIIIFDYILFARHCVHDYINAFTHLHACCLQSPQTHSSSESVITSYSRSQSEAIKSIEKKIMLNLKNNEKFY